MTTRGGASQELILYITRHGGASQQMIICMKIRGGASQTTGTMYDTMWWRFSTTDTDYGVLC